MKKETIKNRVIFKIGDTLCVITHGITSNEKIASPGEKVVQTYHFSRDQFLVAQRTTTMKEFFSYDKPVCMDCPFAVSNGAKLSACYTHKIYQYSGFLSMLRSIGKSYTWDQIQELNSDMILDLLTMAKNKFIRFGTYGEPSLLPVNLVKNMVLVCKTWTGYTHNWKNNPNYNRYFMASVHDRDQVRTAESLGFRSFAVMTEVITGLVNCPASAEQGYKSNCSKCGLCSGSEGKGNKSVVILEH